MTREINTCVVCDDAPPLTNPFGETMQCPQCGAQYENEPGDAISHNWACNELARLQAIVSTLLTTADGYIITPGCKLESVWSIASGEPYELPLYWLDSDWPEQQADEVELADGGGYTDTIAKCYSTKQKAEAARKEGEA